MKNRILPLAFLMFFAGVTLGFPRSSPALTIDLEKPKKTMPPPKKPLGPVLLDARSAFEFATGHILYSINIRWQDYAQTENIHKGCLDPDYGLLARKLRILGIAPGRAVIVIGSGKASHGEDGRVAWMLNFLGVKDVQIKSFDEMPGKKTLEDSAIPLSQPIWLPHPIDSLRISTRDLKSGKNILIDVRMPEELKSIPALPGAVNIPWTDFLNSQGEWMGADNVTRIFKEHGLKSGDVLVIYDSDGLRSSTVAFLAAGAGWVARNYDCGLTEWNGGK